MSIHPVLMCLLAGQIGACLQFDDTSALQVRCHERASESFSSCGTLDIGPMDAGSSSDVEAFDLGGPDIGVSSDASMADQGVLDLGVYPDAEPADIGFPDSGVHPDAAPIDTGIVDAGVVDSGPPPDAGFVTLTITVNKFAPQDRVVVMTDNGAALCGTLIPSPCALDVPAFAIQPITASPDSFNGGSVFQSWGGAASACPTELCSVFTSGDLAVEATFAPDGT